MLSCESCANDTCGFAGTVDGYLTECSWYKPKNNADRIRAMTDEELADEILRWFNWLNAVEWDDKRIIDWLREEVKDEPGRETERACADHEAAAGSTRLGVSAGRGRQKV